MSSELAYEASDEASENELLDRSLSVWKGWTSIEWEDFAPTALDIHTACSIGHYDWVRSIILRGEDPALDQRNHGGWTPLMYACYIGHDNIVSLLINAGCNMNMKNSRGHTPLMLAATCGNETVARTLVRSGAEMELTDKTGWTALFHATYAGHQNFVAFLLEAGANKDAIEASSGMTPFMEAAAEGHEIIVQLFLQHGVNINAKAHNGEMARSLALVNGNMKIISLIDKHVSGLRPQSGHEYYQTSSRETQSRRQLPSGHSRRLKSQSPSIRDGPEAIARMIDRTRSRETVPDSNLLVPKGYVTFPINGSDKEETKMSYRDVTSPINPEDYKDSSGSRALSDLEDFNDDSNAFAQTGAITIRSSSSSSGGLVAALGLSRDGSLDSDDSHLFEQAATSPDDVEFPEITFDGRVKVVVASDSNLCVDANPGHTGGGLNTHVSGQENVLPGCDLVQLRPINSVNGYNFSENNCSLQPNSLVVSPLQDYFPSPSSLPVSSSAASDKAQVVPRESALPPSSSAPSDKPQVVHRESALPPSSSAPSDKAQVVHRESALPPSSHVALPKDNMSQVEIVNRFLKNLTVNNPDTSSDQQHWAGETSAKLSACGYPHPMENLGRTCAEMIPGRCSLSRCVDGKVVEYTPRDGMLHQESGPGNIRLPTNLPQTEFAEGIPGPSFKDTSSADVEGQQFPRSHSSHHHKDTSSADVEGQQFPRPHSSYHHKDSFEQLSNQPWRHHLQLNHHHPLHNRRRLHHSPRSAHHQADSPAGSVRHNHPRPNMAHALSSQSPVKHHAETPEPFLHLPRNYFYRDIEASSHLHQNLFAGTSSCAVPSASTPQVNTAAAQQDFVTRLSTSPYTLPQFVSPVADSTARKLQGSVESQGSLSMVQNPHMQAGQFNTLAKQPISLLHNTGQVGLNPTYSHANHQPLPGLPAAASGSHCSPPPPTAAPQSTPPATIIIPGHVTSQPVSSTIGWDQGCLLQSFGPRDLGEMFTQLGLTKYVDKFEEQDVDLQVFLSMTDNDLKELGVKLFGPRKKMTNAIARWHSSAPIASSNLEQAYADKLEAEMQEMAIQLNQAYENVECLKAQVLQEQQLRSVTEGCLMEERAAWEQSRQIMLNTRAKLRTTGDLMSRLRLHHQELRTSLQQVSTDLLVREPGHSPHVASQGGKTVEEVNTENQQKVSTLACSVTATSSQLLDKSEQCLKEMHQNMVSLVASADHLLKSTHHVGRVEEDTT